MSVLQTLLARRSAGSQRGMATLDILLGMAIFALVVTIGVQNFNTFRGRAYVTQAASDVKQTASAIEAIRTADDKFPDTVTADASNLPGVNLTRGSKIAGYGVTGGNFRACVLSGPKTNQPVAYAIYDSARGTVIESGKGTTNAACDGTGIDTSSTPTDPNSPTNVRVNTTPGQQQATVQWDAVTAATAYAVYLDGAATPAWTGNALTATLTGIAVGDHAVTVTATVSGSQSDPSASAAFTIFGDNDFLRFAHPVVIASAGATWTSRDYTNQNATMEAGENGDLGSNRGMWWTFVAPASGTVRISAVAASDGSGPFPYGGISVWKTAASDIATVQAAPRLLSSYRTNSDVFSAVRGETYKIRVGTTYGDVSKYRVKVETGPINDNAEGAITVPVIPANDSWTSPDQNNDLAGSQPGENSENGSARGMWWTYTAATGGTTRLSIIAASDGTGPYPNGGIHVWETSATDIATIQAAPRLLAGYRSNTGDFTAVKGRTYQIRVGNTYNEVSNFRFRVATGPGNDNVADAFSVGALTSGQTYTSPDVSNDLAGKETGENDDLSAKTLWWTYVAASSGSVRVDVIAATDGSVLNRPSIYVWQSSSTVAPTVQTGPRQGDWSTSSINFNATGGTMYKIRVGNVYGDVSKYRLKVTAP